jgi:hypothetical protein
MSVRNHNLKFRPLRGGIAIFNPNVGELGTLGFVATTNGIDRWIVSCHHVLCRSEGTSPADGEPIFQPVDGDPDSQVARSAAGSADPQLDCAAAKVLDGAEAIGEVLGLGQLAAPLDPLAGMEVVKSGITTGITEGRVRSVTGDRVVIEVAPGFPANYELSGGGDSGAVWVQKNTVSPVVLHTRGNDTGEELAFGVPVRKVLQVLGLQIAP